MKILLKLDNPGSIMAKYAHEVNYAMIADNISDFEEEGKLILCYGTKEEYEKGQGTLTYLEAIEIENIFEWTASVI